MAKHKQAEEKRQYIQAAVVPDPGVKCNHCGALYDHKVLDKKKTSTGPRWYMQCGACGGRFVLIRPDAKRFPQNRNLVAATH